MISMRPDMAAILQPRAGLGVLTFPECLVPEMQRAKEEAANLGRPSVYSNALRQLTYADGLGPTACSFGLPSTRRMHCRRVRPCVAGQVRLFDLQGSDRRTHGPDGQSQNTY